MFDELAALAVDIDTLSPHPENFNRGNVQAIVESLRTNRLYKPVIYDKATGHVLAGNHTLKAARQLGWTQLAAVGITPDPDTARRILAVDNQTAKLSSYDQELQLALLQHLPDLAGTGFSDDDLEDLLALTEEPIELPPAPTQAAWAETEEENEERATRVTGQSTYGARGLSEIILLLTNEDKEDLLRDLDAVALHSGGTTRAQAAGRAARIALVVLDAADTNATFNGWRDMLTLADTSMEDLSA